MVWVKHLSATYYHTYVVGQSHIFVRKFFFEHESHSQGIKSNDSYQHFSTPSPSYDRNYHISENVDNYGWPLSLFVNKTHIWMFWKLGVGVVLLPAESWMESATPPRKLAGCPSKLPSHAPKDGFDYMDVDSQHWQIFELRWAVILGIIKLYWRALWTCVG